MRRFVKSWERVGVLVAVVAALCVAGSGARAQDDAAQVWAGAIELPGMGLELTLTLTPGPDGVWTGAVDLPAQGIRGAAVADLEVTEEGVTFRLPLPNMPPEAIPSFELEFDEAGKAATGEMSQGGMSAPVAMELMTAERVAAEAQARRPQTPTAPFPYRTEEVRVPVSGDGGESHVLAGTLTLPDAEEFGEGPYLCVVLLTGSGPQDRDETIFEHKPFAVIADALARAGVASLRCDERGIADSTGDFATADTHGFAEDALAQVDFVRERSEIDAERVGLLGHSEGGVTAAIVAAEHPEEVSFVAFLAGMALTGKETLLTQSEAMLRLNGAPEEFIEENTALQRAFYDLFEAGAPAEEIRGAMAALVRHQMRGQADQLPPGQFEAVVDQQMQVFDSPWMRTLLGLDPVEHLREVRQPALVMIGELDVQVLPDANVPVMKEALEAAGNKDVTVHRLEGLNHLFQNAETGGFAEYEQIRETFDEGALETLVEWIVAQAED